MNQLDILKMMVRHYPGGIEVVALRLNKAVSTLEKELRSAPGYKLGVLDAEEISCMCIEARSAHCHAYANAVASRCGGFVELPAQVLPLKALRACLADLVKEASDVLMSGTLGLADDDISDNDEKQISRELMELLSRIQDVQAGVRAAHQAGQRRVV